jgi:ribosomal protein L16 Arg81 hydroxylase
MFDVAELDRLIERMLGDTETFFSKYWRKEPHFAPGAAAALRHGYDVEQFLADMVATQSVPYLSVGARDGNRYFTKHETAQSLRDSVGEGGVCAVKMSKIWHGQMPPSWGWMRALFGSLCRRASMLYLSPGRTEDVDMFLAGPNSQLGTHFDTTDVFTLQLFGERKWTVDQDTRVDQVLGFSRSPDWYPAKEIDFTGPTREFTLRPGDALYVPAYSVHRVTGVTWSVSLSLGLRAFNELDVVEQLLETIRLTSYPDFRPLASVPESVLDAHVDAKLGLVHRVRALLQKLEAVTVLRAAAPLAVPETLGGEPATKAADTKVTGMYATGFALFQDGESSKK